jgi:hypothetical protein
MAEENKSEIILYETNSGQTKVEVRFEGETVWLSLNQIAELFGRDKSVVSRHLTNIFTEGELLRDSVVAKNATTAADGKTYQVEYFNLDAVIAVGYRVNSLSATQFRIWATRTLREFIIKGFVLDDERLKHGKRFGRDYFDELLERIREIRASERRFYQKITDIYAQCSIDYDSKADISQTFYQTVQNKLHWAITHQTAAEIIANRADAGKPNMGLQTWKNAPKGKIQKTDVSIAKNYLIEKEIKELERIVSMYLDYAENQAEKQRPMTMADWVQRLDAFLQFNEYDILQDAGKVSHKVATELAGKQYDKFRVVQDQTFESDFDREVKKLKGNDQT